MRRLGIGFFAARSPCQRARLGCPSIGPLDASEASMALPPDGAYSDASRRWRGGELDCWRYERHRRSTQKLVGFFEQLVEFLVGFYELWSA